MKTMFSFIKKLVSRRSDLASADRRVLSDNRVVVGMPRTVQYVDENTGVVCSKVEFVTDYGPDANLKVSDFALQNLLSAGAKLNRASMANVGFKTSDAAIHGIESLDYSKVENPKID